MPDPLSAAELQAARAAAEGITVGLDGEALYDGDICVTSTEGMARIVPPSDPTYQPYAALMYILNGTSMDLDHHNHLSVTRTLLLAHLITVDRNGRMVRPWRQQRRSWVPSNTPLGRSIRSVRAGTHTVPYSTYRRTTTGQAPSSHSSDPYTSHSRRSSGYRSDSSSSHSRSGSRSGSSSRSGGRR